ncbi:MAG TPA: DUF1810 domain-containing protein [Verrucomicrobiota bacterium]|jgi:uncharacterized protein (DUF1810 family)|nr:DUF1810 domain-containing protein [Verrucomicrobiota bacterium]HRT06996.1 DUF1810 domain-containing protein [Candidatus Paceibacterota bacterium]HRT55632.1 DUF1810 domain-containing protein [Candidatus Paceibacterota bacterium]
MQASPPSPSGQGPPPKAPLFNLERFVTAQAPVYDRVLAELRSGRKRTHWMWFIFPQIAGLGSSSTSVHFAIQSLEEARAYLEHPVLGSRLVECAGTVLGLEGRTVSEVFPFPDDLKLRSSMTLFECAGGPGLVFSRVLDKYFGGSRDERTLELLNRGASRG